MGVAPLDLVIIVAAISLGAFVKGATGVGLQQIAIPVIAAFLGVEHAVVVMAIPGVASNALLVWSHRREARQTRDLPVMLAAAVVGAVLGTFLLDSLDGRVLSACLAVVIVGYIVVATLHPGLTLSPRVTRVASPPVGLAAGGLQGATGISGPLVTTYLHGFGLPPRAYVFALSSMFCVSATVSVATLGAIGLYSGPRLLESVLALLPILLVLPLGSRAARRLSRRTFQRVILVLLAASLVPLVLDVVGGGCPGGGTPTAAARSPLRSPAARGR